MSKAMATYLNGKFPGSTITKFPSADLDAFPVVKRGRKSLNGQPQTGAARKRKTLANAKAKATQTKLGLLTVSEVNDKKSSETGNEITLYNIEEWPIALLGSIYAKRPAVAEVDSFSVVAGFLEEKSKRHVVAKDNNQLFNLTNFAARDGVCHGKTLEDVISSGAILMDMDSEANCDPIAFEEFMNGIELITYSSFSSSATRQRWRAVIPLSRPVTAGEYRQIASDLIGICSANGFPFDNKKAANDFMYLPAIGANPDVAFFRYVTGEDRRYLPVDQWLAA